VYILSGSMLFVRSAPGATAFFARFGNNSTKLENTEKKQISLSGVLAALVQCAVEPA
jgi:hypothetical protein